MSRPRSSCGWSRAGSSCGESGTALAKPARGSPKVRGNSRALLGSSWLCWALLAQPGSAWQATSCVSLSHIHQHSSVWDRLPLLPSLCRKKRQRSGGQLGGMNPCLKPGSPGTAPLRQHAGTLLSPTPLRDLWAQGECGARRGLAAGRWEGRRTKGLSNLSRNCPGLHLRGVFARTARPRHEMSASKLVSSPEEELKEGSG